MASRVRIEIAATGRPIAGEAWTAANAWERMVGLLATERLGPGQGLLLAPCGSVHTFGMRFSIDILFLDRQNRVLAVARDVGPCRVRVGPRGARSVLELAAGAASAAGVREGDALRFVPR